MEDDYFEIDWNKEIHWNACTTSMNVYFSAAFIWLEKG